MNIFKKHVSRTSGRKSFLRLGACFTAAAIMGTMAVSASAEELRKIVTAPGDGFGSPTDLGDGYFKITTYDEKGNETDKIVCIDDEVLKNWRETGTLNYDIVKTDLKSMNIGFSRTNLGTDLSSSDYIVINDYDNNKKYLMKCDKKNHTFTTLQTLESTSRYDVTSDGYVYICNYDSQSNSVKFSITKPDGTTVENNVDLKGYVNDMSLVWCEDEKYCGFFLMKKEGATREIPDGDYNTLSANTYTLFGVDKKGNATKIKDIESVVIGPRAAYDKANGNINVLFCNPDENKRQYLVYSIKDGTSKTIDEDKFEDLSRYQYQDESRLADDSSLYDRKDNHVIAKYDSISTKDGQIFTVRNRNSENNNYGYIDRDGKELAKFDRAGDFAGDYAPVIKDGKAFFIDRNMKKVSEEKEIDAYSVRTLADGLYLFSVNGDDGMGELLATYTGDSGSNKNNENNENKTEKPLTLPSFFTVKIDTDGVVTPNNTQTTANTNTKTEEEPKSLPEYFTVKFE